MTLTRDEIAREAFKLSQADREMLAFDLAHGILPEERAAIDASVLAEVQRREAAFERGEMAAYSAEEVLETLRQRIRR